MLASACSFDQLLKFAVSHRILAEAMSFIQVEYGLNELRTCWAGFTDTSDHFGQTFSSCDAIFAEFTSALSDYIEYLNEPVFK